MKKSVVYLVICLMFVLSACSSGYGKNLPDESKLSSTAWALTESSKVALETTGLPPVETLPVYGEMLTEAELVAAFALHKPDVQMLGMGRTMYFAYAFYRPAESPEDIRIDRLHPYSGEVVEENVLAGQGSYRIHGFSKTDLSVYELTVYMTGLDMEPDETRNEPVYPEVYHLTVVDGDVVVSSVVRETLYLPLPMDGFYRGYTWTNPKLAECRVGFDHVALRFEAAPDAEKIEGGENMPRYRADYDEGAHTLEITFYHTTIANMPTITAQNDYVKDVSIQAFGADTKATIQLHEGVSHYAQTYETHFLQMEDSEQSYGVLTFFFRASGNEIQHFE